MTRRNNYFGSFTRILKRTAVVAALLFTAPTLAEESQYKVRLHRNFIKSVMDKNFPVVLEHIQNKVDKHVFLSEIDASLDNLSLEIKPFSGEWDSLNTELFFDQGQIVMEINGLEFVGSGTITDPNTGKQDTVNLKASLDLAQLVLSLDQELTEEGYIYPKIEISEVAFTLHKDLFLVQT
jgi:hypothetical protein